MLQVSPVSWRRPRRWRLKRLDRRLGPPLGRGRVRPGGRLLDGPIRDQHQVLVLRIYVLDHLPHLRYVGDLLFSFSATLGPRPMIVCWRTSEMLNIWTLVSSPSSKVLVHMAYPRGDCMIRLFAYQVLSGTARRSTCDSDSMTNLAYFFVMQETRLLAITCLSSGGLRWVLTILTLRHNDLNRQSESKRLRLVRL